MQFIALIYLDGHAFSYTPDSPATFLVERGGAESAVEVAAGPVSPLVLYRGDGVIVADGEPPEFLRHLVDVGQAAVQPLPEPEPAPEQQPTEEPVIEPEQETTTHAE